MRAGPLLLLRTVTVESNGKLPRDAIAAVAEYLNGSLDSTDLVEQLKRPRGAAAPTEGSSVTEA